jgi:acyl-CoA thioesterase I
MEVATMKIASRYFYLLMLSCAVLGGAVQGAQAQIVALGASNVEGKGVRSSEAFPAVLEQMLRAKGRNLTVKNAGVSGETSAEILSRVSSDVPEGTKIVLLGIGRFNDARRGRGGGATQENTQLVHQKLAARGIRVINAQPFIMGTLRAGHRQEDGIHLTVEGHRIVAAKLAPLIR